MAHEGYKLYAKCLDHQTSWGLVVKPVFLNELDLFVISSFLGRDFSSL